MNGLLNQANGDIIELVGNYVDFPHWCKTGIEITSSYRTCLGLQYVKVVCPKCGMVLFDGLAIRK